MGFSSFNQQRNHGIMGEEGLDDSIPSSSEVSSVVSSESDILEEEEDDDVTSSTSFLPENPSPAAASSPSGQLPTGPLSDMSSLIQQLPIKRGLSMHFQGKSQSFTCLSNVTCLEDLAKPEKPYNKRLKSCKSHAVLSESHKSSNPTRSKSSRFISKMAPRDHSCSSLTAKRPPINSPQRSTSTSSFSNQTPLFA